MATVEQRLQRLEDIEEIRTLKQKYAKLCDTGLVEPGLSELFTKDAHWDADELGFYLKGKADAQGVHLKGTKEIHAFFDDVSSSFSFALHYTLGHIIDVDDNGVDAKGTWYIWMPATVSDSATFLAATYEDTYKKVSGTWKCDSVRVHLGFFTRYENGWAKERVAEL